MNSIENKVENFFKKLKDIDDDCRNEDEVYFIDLLFDYDNIKWDKKEDRIIIIEIYKKVFIYPYRKIKLDELLNDK